MMFRKREKQIAKAMIEEIAGNLDNPLLGTPEFLLLRFKEICGKFSYSPSEAEARRIFVRVGAEAQRRQQAAFLELCSATMVAGHQ